jgi:hypothetical protein
LASHLTCEIKEHRRSGFILLVLTVKPTVSRVTCRSDVVLIPALDKAGLCPGYATRTDILRVSHRGWLRLTTATGLGFLLCCCFGTLGLVGWEHFLDDQLQAATGFFDSGLG